MAPKSEDNNLKKLINEEIPQAKMFPASY